VVSYSREFLALVIQFDGDELGCFFWGGRKKREAVLGE
jgi:hypothetical protein